MMSNQALKNCPYPVEEKITSHEIEEICSALEIEIKTTPQQFADALNLYYEGYNQHKRTYQQKGKTTKSEEKILCDLANSAKKLKIKLDRIESPENRSILDRINAFTFLAHKREETKARSLRDINQAISSLILEAERPVMEISGINHESSSKQWFLAVALPKVYESNTNLKYSRAYNSEHGNRGKCHQFVSHVLKYFDDFKHTTDSAIDSAIPNYKKSKDLNAKEFEWPYEWGK